MNTTPDDEFAEAHDPQFLLGYAQGYEAGYSQGIIEGLSEGKLFSNAEAIDRFKLEAVGNVMAALGSMKKAFER